MCCVGSEEKRLRARDPFLTPASLAGDYWGIRREQIWQASQARVCPRRIVIRERSQLLERIF